mgnify:FL=1|tara:strand:+ start:318 stop:824 length:507 start_codon:yes stop_codon:yes gene_type:complete
MEKGLRIINNFLDKDFFERLKTLIIKSEFSWFKRETMVAGSTNNLGYFTHSFYNNHRVTSERYYEYILPILNKLDSKATITARANLTPSVFYKENSCAFHTDQKFNCKTAILYLNTCDGGTEFKIEDKIKFVKSEENKIVIFDTNIEHRGTKSNDADFRYLINFNYFA